MRYRMFKLLVRVSFIVVFIINMNFIVRASEQKDLKILIPAYFDPVHTNYWEIMANEAEKLPSKIYAIANVNNGAGENVKISYTKAINNMRSKGGKVIGYVDSDYTNVSLDNIKDEIDSWYSKYEIDGIFIDCQHNIEGYQLYYAIVYNYIKEKDSKALVVTNPGTNTLETYVKFNKRLITDVICVYENFEGFDRWKLPSWTENYSSDTFAVIPYDIWSNNWRQTVDYAASMNVSWFYATDESGYNKWGSLPSYFKEMCYYIKENYTIYNSNIILELGNTNMIVNSEYTRQIDHGYGITPVILNNRMLIPFRAVIEELGGDANWNSDKRVAIFSRNNTVIKINLKNVEKSNKLLYKSKLNHINDTFYESGNMIIRNGEKFENDSPSIIYNDRVYVPLRFIAESLNCLVVWNESDQSVVIKFNK